MASYSTGSRTDKSEDGSIFDVSKPTVKWIDFNETGPDSPRNSATGGPTDIQQQPAVKKRKLTIISDAQKAKLDKRREAVAELAGSADTASQQQSRKESAASYLKSVKGSVDAATYATFSTMTATYRKDKDVEALLKTLAKLFPVRSPLAHLFTGENFKFVM